MAKSDAELLKSLDEAFQEAWDIVHSEDGWKQEKVSDQGDVVMSKKNKKGKKMYRTKVVLDVSPDKLIDVLENNKKITEWNTTLTKFEILKDLGQDNAKISYQVTTEAGPGGMVAARDFILLFKQEKRGEEWMQAGLSIEYPDGPEANSGKIVRAWNNPGGVYIRPVDGKCEFVWLMDCEFRGMLPEAVLDMAMPMAQIQFIDCVKKLAATL